MDYGASFGRKGKLKERKIVMTNFQLPKERNLSSILCLVGGINFCLFGIQEKVKERRKISSSNRLSFVIPTFWWI